MSLRDKISLNRQRNIQQRLRRAARPAWLGTVRTTRPLSDGWGYDRGTPVDRYYIEAFLEQRQCDIRGRVLEVKDRSYTEQFGLGVDRSDVLDINPNNPHVTLIADLAAAGAIPADTFDCFVLTQTLQFIYDTRAALFHAHRILRPGGVLLVTVPAVSKLDRRLTDYWRFTTASCTRLFAEVFGQENIIVESFGNVLTAISFLLGMAAEELSQAELDEHDKAFPLVVAVRAVKADFRQNRE
jgi:SAM-dependent methyltransferase